MSYREMTMTDVREVLRRWQAGNGYRESGRQTGSDRKTVKRYVVAAKRLGVTRETELDDEIIGAVARAVTARPAVEKSEERRALDPHRKALEEWLLVPKPLKLTKVHDLLERRGVEITYSTLRRYVVDELGWHQRGLYHRDHLRHFRSGPVPLFVRHRSPPSGASGRGSVLLSPGGHFYCRSTTGT